MIEIRDLPLIEIIERILEILEDQIIGILEIIEIIKIILIEKIGIIGIKTIPLDHIVTIEMIEKITVDLHLKSLDIAVSIVLVDQGQKDLKEATLIENLHLEIEIEILVVNLTK